MRILPGIDLLLAPNAGDVMSAARGDSNQGGLADGERTGRYGLLCIVLGH